MKLLAVKTPWQLESSTPFLEMNLYENGEAIISANVNFGLNKKNPDLHKYPLDKIQNMGLFTGENFEEFKYQRINIRFEHFYSVIMNPPQTGIGVIDESKYDWSKIKFHNLFYDDIYKWQEKKLEYWTKTGYCPDPNMYEIKNSIWLENPMVVRLSYKHFLILGHDS